MDQDSLCLWHYLQLGHTPVPADLILVLGSGDLRVAEYGAQLWHERMARRILISGAFGLLTKQIFSQSEARTFAARMHALNVPPKVISLEERATNTGENFRFSHELLARRAQNVSKLLVVSKNYLERRAFYTARRYFNCQIIVTSPRLSMEQYINQHYQYATLQRRLCGEIERLVNYNLLGFFGHFEPIDNRAWQSYAKLSQEI